ncbi:MAG TPA: hypothetical protein VG815_18145 [Chloroflexota bacterium]|jgi:hypothetical protein|nr:hypothetical protein [Chloroflexota bacterium]
MSFRHPKPAWYFAIMVATLATFAGPLVVQGRGPHAARTSTLPSFLMRPIGQASTQPRYVPSAINDGGMLAGTDIAGPVPRGFFFTKKKLSYANPPAGMAGATIVGLNNANMVAGTGCQAQGCAVLRAFVGQIQTGRVHWKSLPNPKGPAICTHRGCNSQGNGIGPTGDVTGWEATTGVLWTRLSNGHYSAKRLPTSDSTHFNTTTGLAVDAFGDVVGTESGSFSTVGIMWPAHGKPFILPDFCGEFLVRGSATFSAPFALSASGGSAKREVTVVGKCLLYDETTKTLGFGPCVWKVSIDHSTPTITATTRLDANVGSDGGLAGAINRHGWIAGNQGDAASSATLWIHLHPHLLADLTVNNPGWTFQSLQVLNNTGALAVIATNGSLTGTFLLTPR